MLYRSVRVLRAASANEDGRGAGHGELQRRGRGSELLEHGEMGTARGGLAWMARTLRQLLEQGDQHAVDGLCVCSLHVQAQERGVGGRANGLWRRKRD